MDQGAWAVAAILAVLNAGKFYVPLDVGLPEALLSRWCQDAEARLILATREYRDLAARLVGAHGRVLEVEACASDVVAAADSEDDGKRVGAERLAYLFYTSGTTGRPKGVIDSHRNVLHNVMRYTNGLRIAPSDRLSLIQAPCFSGTVSSVFSALLNGAAVCPFSFRTEGFVALVPWVNEMSITVFHSVPALFRGLTAAGVRFPSVRWVRLEGDQVLAGDLALFREGFEASCRLAIGLGATETGLSCQLRLSRSQTSGLEGPIPVGQPLPDFEVTVLDERGEPAPSGEVGEIAVRSRYLAVGYWRQEELTRRTFRPDAEDPMRRTYQSGDMGRVLDDGTVVYLGRKDHQSKVRGQRVEVTEVEAELGRLDGVLEVVATVREDTPGDPRLVAYLVVRRGFEWDTARVRSFLAGRLPDVMIPSAIVILDALPITPHGKIDRRALPGPGPSSWSLVTSESTDGARDEIEERLLRVWRELFAGRAMAVTDDFFELGGDSLMAAQLCLRVWRRMGSRLTPAQVAVAPSVRRMATLLRDGRLETTEAGLVRLRVGGNRPALFCLHDHVGSVLPFAALSRHWGDERSCFGVQGDVWRGDATGGETLEAMAAGYRERIQRVQPRGPYHLAGLCFGGVVAFEMARQWVVAGERVGLVALIAVSPADFPNLVAPSAVRLHRLHLDRNRLASNLRYHGNRLRQMPIREIPGYVFARAAASIAYLRHRFRALRSSAAQRRPEESAAARRHRALFEGYRAAPFPGSLTLVLSLRTTWAYSRDPAADWGGLATARVTIHLMDGSDLGLLQEPQVGLTAVNLAEDLRRIENDGNVST